MKYDTFPLFFQGHSASNVFQCVNGYYRKDLPFEKHKTLFYTFVAVIMKRILVGPIFSNFAVSGSCIYPNIFLVISK